MGCCTGCGCCSGLAFQAPCQNFTLAAPCWEAPAEHCQGWPHSLQNGLCLAFLHSDRWDTSGTLHMPRSALAPWQARSPQPPGVVSPKPSTDRLGFKGSRTLGPPGSKVSKKQTKNLRKMLALSQNGLSQKKKGIFDSKARAPSRDLRSESDHHSRLGQHRVPSTKRCQHIGWQTSGGHLASSSLPLRRATAGGVATATCEKQPWSPLLHLTPGLTPACHNTGRPPCFRLPLHRRATA